MKTKSLFLLALPLLFIAATSRHQAFGPAKFGMLPEEFNKAMNQVRHITPKNPFGLDASTVRNHFVTSGTRKTGKLVSVDRNFPMGSTSKGIPLVTEVTVTSLPTLPANYGTSIKSAWEDLQDIGDSKWTRVGKPGAFPAMEEFGPEKDVIITDTWEVEGIRIELRVHREEREATSYRPAGTACWTSFRATEITPAK